MRLKSDRSIVPQTPGIFLFSSTPAPGIPQAALPSLLHSFIIRCGSFSIPFQCLGLQNIEFYKVHHDFELEVPPTSYLWD